MDTPRRQRIAEKSLRRGLACLLCDVHGTPVENVRIRWRSDSPSPEHANFELTVDPCCRTLEDAVEHWVSHWLNAGWPNVE